MVSAGKVPPPRPRRTGSFRYLLQYSGRISVADNCSAAYRVGDVVFERYLIEEVQLTPRGTTVCRVRLRTDLLGRHHLACYVAVCKSARRM